MAFCPEGRHALSRWRVVEQSDMGYLLELSLETGRTHQLRVHLSHCGAPILGDRVYGRAPRNITHGLRGEVELLGRQALHAARLSFRSPLCGKILSFSSDLPPDISRLKSYMWGTAPPAQNKNADLA